MLIMKFQNFHFRNFSPKPCVIIKKIDGEWFQRHHMEFYCFYDSERKIMIMSWFSHFRVMNKNCNAGVYLYNCGYGRTYCKWLFRSKIDEICQNLPRLHQFNDHLKIVLSYFSYFLNYEFGMNVMDEII